VRVQSRFRDGERQLRVEARSYRYVLFIFLKLIKKNYSSNNTTINLHFITERHSVEVRKGGEVALGILFALTFVAGAFGWYLVWQNRRTQYQTVN
jgi:hypothetical protein